MKKALMIVCVRSAIMATAAMLLIPAVVFCDRATVKLILNEARYDLEDGIL